MVQVREIMTSELVTLSPEASVREAMEVLGRHHLSGAPVMWSGSLVGVVSATDLMTFASALPGVPTERETNGDWSEWAEESEDDVPEDPEGGTAFFAELWDDAGVDTTTRTTSLSGPEWNVLEEHDVSEVMTRPPLVTLPPDADVHSAADLMRRQRIHRVLVTQGERLVGVVSALDIARAVADHRVLVVPSKERDLLF